LCWCAAQDFLSVMFLLMQQTTGVPRGRAVVHSMMRTLASMLQVPETKAHLAAFPDFPNLLDRLLNLHGTCLYDVELTMLSGRLCKQFVKEMPEFVLGHSRFISVIMEFTREVREVVSSGHAAKQLSRSLLLLLNPSFTYKLHARR